jgi:hypothetical protein
MSKDGLGRHIQRWDLTYIPPLGLIKRYLIETISSSFCVALIEPAAVNVEITRKTKIKNTQKIKPQV